MLVKSWKIVIPSSNDNYYFGKDCSTIGGSDAVEDGGGGGKNGGGRKVVRVEQVWFLHVVPR